MKLNLLVLTLILLERMEGALSKWTNVMKGKIAIGFLFENRLSNSLLPIGWQYRWFVLDDSAGIFSYYTSKEKMTRGVRRGCVRLRGALIGIDDEVGVIVFDLFFLANATYEILTYLIHNRMMQRLRSL